MSEALELLLENSNPSFGQSTASSGNHLKSTTVYIVNHTRVVPKLHYPDDAILRLAKGWIKAFKKQLKVTLEFYQLNQFITMLLKGNIKHYMIV